MTDDLREPDFLAVLSIAGTAIDGRVLAGLAEAGFAPIRPNHGYLIQRLLTGPQLITDMAGDLGVSQQAVSKMVKELIARGLAAQQIDAEDSRRRPITLTDRGRAAVYRARAVRDHLAADLEMAVGPEDLATAQRVLDVLVEQLGLGQRVTDRMVAPPPES